MSIEIARRIRSAIRRKSAADDHDYLDSEIARRVWARAGLKPPTASAVGRYLNGARGVPCAMLPYFAEELGVDLRWLITGEGAADAGRVADEVLRDALEGTHAHARRTGKARRARGA